MKNSELFGTRKEEEKMIIGISLQAVCIVIQAALLAALGVAWALNKLN